MKLTPEQLRFLLSNTSSGEELENAMIIMEENEELSELLQNEWEEISANSPVSEETKKKIWQKIRKETKVNVGNIWWWAAAIFVLTVSIPFIWHQPTGQKEWVVNQKQDKQPTVFSDTTIWNHSSARNALTLPDGTKVILLAESSIRFQKNIGAKDSKKRDVFISGDVYFDVTRNAEKPFTVYTGTISTRVLGTSFRVTQNASQVRIKLYTGRILLSHEVENLPGWEKDLSIKSGTEVSYKKNIGLLAISKFNSPEVTASKQQEFVNGQTNQESITFNNEPLSTVFDRLGKYYGVTIEYDRREVEQKHFSGKILRTDSILATLALMADLNDLMVTGTDGQFTIRPQQK